MDASVNNKSSFPIFKKNSPDDSDKFQPLPEPPGVYPFHLDLQKILPENISQKLVFQMVGDTGSVRKPDFQKLVVSRMIKQFQETDMKTDNPKFLYHLGDVVYNFGEASNYPAQFFNPYQNYPGPIFAIPGNHDGDINPVSPNAYNSLDAFTKVFCNTDQTPIPFSGDTNNLGNTQPNFFWTLQTSLANIIGLYSNVTKYGVITKKQKEWFKEELKVANEQRPEKAVLVCLHHSPYSADTNHGSSLAMITFLEDAFSDTGVRPDIVFSGHVHNYQRFEKTYTDGASIPFIVAGGGGYDELHPLAGENDPSCVNDSPYLKGVRLLNYCDDRHGFLKITLERKNSNLTLTGEYYAITTRVDKNDKVQEEPIDIFRIII